MRVTWLVLAATLGAACSFDHGGIALTNDAPASGFEATPPGEARAGEVLSRLEARTDTAADHASAPEARADMRPDTLAPFCNCGASCAPDTCYAESADTCTGTTCSCGGSPACTGGQSCCAGSCSALDTNGNCGGCGVSCHSGQACAPIGTGGGLHACTCMNPSQCTSALAPTCAMVGSVSVCVCSTSGATVGPCNPRLSDGCGGGQCTCGGAPGCDPVTADHCDATRTPACRCGLGAACTGGKICDSKTATCR